MAAHENLATQFEPVYRTEHGSAKVSPTGYVWNLSVYGSRGRGRGTELMQQITADADRLGKPLTVHAREELHPFYQRLGFEKVGTDELGHRLERKPRSAA